MFDGWKVAGILFDFKRFFFLLPLQWRAVLNCVKPHYLPLCMSVASIHQNIVVYSPYPVKVLEKGDLFIYENSSMLLQHSSHHY